MKNINYQGHNIIYREGTTDEFVLNEVLNSQCYNAEFRCDRSPTVIDIGGHIGTFTLYIKTKYPDATVHVYEPDAESFNILTLNTRNLSNVIVHNKAVSNNPTETLYRQGNHTAGYSTVHKEDLFSIEGTEVSCYSLDDIIDDNDLECVNILKIDCEGAEYDILTKCKFLNVVDNIVMEYHEFAESSDTFIELINFLDGVGFRLMETKVEEVSPQLTRGTAFFVNEELLDKPFNTIDQYFDQTYLINMDKRPDRLEEASRQLAKAGIHKIKRITGVEIPIADIPKYPPETLRNFHIGNCSEEQRNKYIAASIGVRKSHLECIKDAKAMGHKRILILEDDIVVREDANKVFANVIKQVGDNWQLLYLGGDYRANNVTFQMSSYGLHVSLFDEILENMEASGLEDDYYLIQHIQPKVKVIKINPMIMWQHKRDTDIQIT